MTDLFLKVVNMSISAGWLVLAVVLLRLFLKKAPKWVNVLLWGLVAVRLICPLSPESALSLIPSAETISPEIMTDAAPTIHTGIPVINSTVNPVLSQTFAPEPGDSVNPLQVWIPVLAGAWVAGMLVMAAYTMISCLRLRRKVQTAVRLRDNIYQSKLITSPFVFGMFRPRIYLPFSMDERNTAHVIAHEQAHIRRRDHWWKPLGFTLLTVHWFNPLMWLAYVLLCRDVELACDERVIRELGPDQRADYSQALLSCSVSRGTIAACPLAFGEVGVKERVKSVLNYRKPAFWVIVAAILVCIAVAVCFLTNPAQPRDTLAWAQALSAGDIAGADLVVLPQDANQQFKRLSEEEFSAVAGLIRQSDGKYRARHEDLDGVSIFFYLTMKDGTTHSVGNIGNTYLVIDGDYFEAEYEWLAAWSDDFGAGDGPLPDGYFSTSTVVRWLDDRDLFQETEVHVSQFPDVTFQCSYGWVAASSGTTQTVLVDGMSNRNMCFADLNGDGLPEICATSSFGSGLIDSHVVVVDYSTGYDPEKVYTLWERGEYDYVLRLENGNLICDKRVYPSGDVIESGALVLADDGSGDGQALRIANRLDGSVEQRIAELLDTIQSSPAASSNPGDYIQAHKAAYQELLGYGEHTLQYCFTAFLAGNQTDLRGHIMARACEEIASAWGEAFIMDDPGPETGQDWFDAFRQNAENLAGQYSREAMHTLYPASWLLLQMLPDPWASVQVYVFRESDQLPMPHLMLKEDGTFSFFFSVISSYLGSGTYEIRDNRLTLRTSDGQYVYVFNMENGTLIFDAGASSKTTWFSGLYDGALME